MEDIGVDLGSKDSQICVRSGGGEITGEWRWRTDRLSASFWGGQAARIILETRTEAFGIAALA
jgi:transposase